MSEIDAPNAWVIVGALAAVVMAVCAVIGLALRVQLGKLIRRMFGQISTSTKFFLVAFGLLAVAPVLMALAYELAITIEERHHKRLVASISDEYGLRLKCEGGCSSKHKKVAHGCYQAALQAADRVSGTEIGPATLSIQLTRAMTSWRGCLEGEGISLERCALTSPDCEYSDKPFLLQYIGRDFFLTSKEMDQLIEDNP